MVSILYLDIFFVEIFEKSNQKIIRNGKERNRNAGCGERKAGECRRRKYQKRLRVDIKKDMPDMWNGKYA